MSDVFYSCKLYFIKQTDTNYADKGNVNQIMGTYFHAILIWVFLIIKENFSL